jgi:RimJ/RimL family protein N-acetyltransferase
MSNTYPFETDRLWLRPTDERDAAFIIRLVNSPKWIRFIGPRNVHTEEEAVAYIDRMMMSQQRRLGFSNYTFIRKEDEVKLGFCGLYDREGLEGFDLGYALLEEFEGNGYAFEAACKVRDMAFDEFGIKELQAITDPENKASQIILERLGFQFKHKVTLPNEKKELYYYQLEKMGRI